MLVLWWFRSGPNKRYPGLCCPLTSGEVRGIQRSIRYATLLFLKSHGVLMKRTLRIFAATLTLLFARSMQAQTRVDLTQDVQGVLPAAHRGVPAAAAGSALVSNDIGKLGMYRVKPNIDVRDWGVDCTGVADAAAILNSHTNVQDGISGDHIIIPNGCVLNLTSGQWQIFGNQGFEIEGVAILHRSSPLIKYCGPGTDDSTLKIERSGGWTIKGLMIESTGSGCSNSTPVGVILDNDRSGGYTLTDGVFDRVMIATNFNGTHITNWTGVETSPIAKSNVEDIRFINSSISCNQSTNAIGVNLGASFNAKLEDFQHTQISFCPGGGIHQFNGDMMLRGMDTSGNTAGDILLGAGSDSTLIEKIDSESPKMIAFTNVGGLNFPATIMASHLGYAGAKSSGLCGIDLLNAGGGSIILVGDSSDIPPPGAFPLCTSLNVDLTMVGNQFYTGNGVVPSGSTFMLPSGHNFGRTYGVFKGGRMRMGNGANYGAEDIGYGFFSQYGVEINGYGFNAQSLEDGHVPGELSIGKDVMYLGDQNITLNGMWPIPMESVTCSYTGAAGSTHWRAQIFPKDAKGNRGGAADFNGNYGCRAAASTLSGSNYLTLVWPRVTNAVSYDVVLLSPSNSSQGLLVATVADPGSRATATTNITTGSTGSSFNYVFPNFYDSAITTIKGESLMVNAPPTFTAAVTLPALNLATPYISATAPAISSGFGASPSIVHSNGTAVFTINVGTGGTATSGLIRLPKAANGWAVHCDDVTTQSPSVFVTKQTATSATTATLTQYSDAAVPTAWAASDVLVCQAAAY